MEAKVEAKFENESIKMGQALVLKALGEIYYVSVLK